jgi:hypothetical protein
MMQERRQTVLVELVALLGTAALIAGLCISVFALLEWLISLLPHHAGYMQDQFSNERMDDLSDYAMYSVYTFFHTGDAHDIPHGLIKAVVTVELFTSWYVQIALILWGVARFGGRAIRPG